MPEEEKYRLLKTSDEVRDVDEEDSEGKPAHSEEPSDPRKNQTRQLASSIELIQNYGYSSELTLHEHRSLLNALSLRITHHNPKLLTSNIAQRIFRQRPVLNQNLRAKLILEASHLNKCAEIFFYRHVNEFKELISERMKAFLIERWKSRENKFDRNYQVITMLLRDHVINEDFRVELTSQDTEEFNREAFLISDQKFPSLSCFSDEDLKFYCSLKDNQKEAPSLEQTFDIYISIDLLSQLLVDTEQFSASFCNQEDDMGNLKTLLESSLPPKCATIDFALEEIVRASLLMSIEWSMIDELFEEGQDLENSVQSRDLGNTSQFQVKSVKDFMTSAFLRLKKSKGSNSSKHLWTMSNQTQSFKLLVEHHDIFFIRKEEVEFIPVSISIKLEYQSKFGAEKMSRSELLKEWCRHKFSNSSITLRYRIDAGTLIILSITQLSLDEIEKEMLDAHNMDPNKSIGNLSNLFGCLKKLPQANYKLQTKLENSCNKLLIFKATDDCGSSSSTDEPWEIESVFSRKWIEIDESTPSFLHMNHFFAPCCFPMTKGKRQCSYKPKTHQPKKFKQQTKEVTSEASSTVQKISVPKKQHLPKRKLSVHNNPSSALNLQKPQRRRQNNSKLKLNRRLKKGSKPT